MISCFSVPSVQMLRGNASEPRLVLLARVRPAERKTCRRSRLLGRDECDYAARVVAERESRALTALRVSYECRPVYSCAYHKSPGRGPSAASRAC